MAMTEAAAPLVTSMIVVIGFLVYLQLFSDASGDGRVREPKPAAFMECALGALIGVVFVAAVLFLLLG